MTTLWTLTSVQVMGEVRLYTVSNKFGATVSFPESQLDRMVELLGGIL